MKYAIGIAAIAGALFMAVPGGVIFWMGLRSVWRGLASSHWPTVSGVVLHGGMTEDQAKQAGTRNTYTFYSANLEFRYRVNGRDYTTQTVQFGRAIGSGDISSEAVLLLRYPEGGKATVFYHPHDPALATVRPGVNTDVAWYLCGGAILILFGVFCVLGYLWGEPDFTVTPYITGLIWTFFMLFGIAILAPGLRNFWYARASQSWPTTNGVVVYAEQEATSQVLKDSHEVTTHGAPLAYRYEVNGTQYFSNVRHFGQFISSSSQEWSEAILQRYPSGTGVPVSYCPTDPDLAALEPGIHSESYYLPGGGLAFLLFGIAGVVWSTLR
ncbi:MAG TPA: DUF3592 domain-containing protein [Thermodesulfobacteriota bacterium]|nr:DUF3592 domain-containing protein [Thermodesulfobacteriota bacterium]